MAYLEGPVRQPADDVDDDDDRDDIDDMTPGRVARRRKHTHTTWPDVTARDAKATDEQRVQADDDGQRTGEPDDCRVRQVGAGRYQRLRARPSDHTTVSTTANDAAARLRHVVGEQQHGEHENERRRPDDCHGDDSQLQCAESARNNRPPNAPSFPRIVTQSQSQSQSQSWFNRRLTKRNTRTYEKYKHC